VRSFESLRWLLTRAALDGHDVRLTVASSRDGLGRDVILPLGSMDASEADARLFQRIGIVAPLDRTTDRRHPAEESGVARGPSER
jgi:regulator of sigma E protease